MKFVGTIAAELSGSLGGIVASRNRGGGYFRQRVTPVNPNTPRQSIIRTITQELSDRWANVLTQAQRNAWDNWVEMTPGFVGTGIDGYIYCNMTRQYYAAQFAQTVAIIDTAPGSFDIGSFSPISAVMTVTNNIAVTFDNTDSWADTTGGFLFVFASPPMNPSRKAYSGRYNLVTAIVGDTAMPPTSPASLASPFPFVAGQRIFVRVAASQPDGRYSAKQTVTGLAQP
jgi:hypothetical protein